jgi:hypothetical protein
MGDEQLQLGLLGLCGRWDEFSTAPPTDGAPGELDDPLRCTLEAGKAPALPPVSAGFTQRNVGQDSGRFGAVLSSHVVRRQAY